MTVFSYCLLFDNGAAPNPFWGLCTLAICKPVIRRTAQVGDWVLGTGSKEYGLENQMIYAMKITNVLSLKEYDLFCKNYLENKIPVWKTEDLRLKVGDCIYDYSKGNPVLRLSVHRPVNMKTDLGGKNVLLSNHFYYFGSKPVPLPSSLLPIVKQGQGHKSKSNEPYMGMFLAWIASFEEYRNKVNTKPYGLKDSRSDESILRCSKQNQIEDEKDEELECS